MGKIVHLGRKKVRVLENVDSHLQSLDLLFSIVVQLKKKRVPIMSDS